MTLKRVLAVAAAAGLLIGGCYAGYLRHRAGQTVSIAPTGGTYPVGRAVHELADRSRTDELAPLGGNPRVLSVWLWYPAVAHIGHVSAYAPGTWAGLHQFGWAQTDFDRIRTGTYDDPPVADGTFPIVVLLPGLGLAAPQYSALAAGLAAEGYLVAGVTPTYSAKVTVLGGRPVRASAAGDPSRLDGPGAARLAAVWAADARFVAGRMAALLGNHAEQTRVAYVGHSFGGAAAVEACRTDVLCAGAADLDGTPIGPVVSLGLQHPLLLLSAGRDGAAADPAAHQMFAASGPSSWAYTIAGAGSFAFTDYPAYWLAAPVRAALPVVAARPALPMATGYLTAFLTTALRGSPWRPPAATSVEPTEMLVR